MTQPVSWRLTGAIGQIRVATFQERSHLVVPVVALVEGVLHPANTQNPEYVPPEVISHAPQGWNGRPVVLGHPKIGADFVSANSPEILEREGIGVIFNAEIKKEKLVLEAWIDKERAAKQGTETEKLVTRLEAGEMTEVSIGALVSAKKVVGNHKGKQYHAIWQHLVPDHLAFLHKGDIGACSNEAGCGGNRVAMHFVTAQGFELVGEETMSEPVTPPEPPKKTLRERFLEVMKFTIGMSVEDMSDRDLRSALERALGGEPGFLGIDSVFPSESKVIYAVGSQQSIQLFSREYTFTKNGDIKLAAKAEEVQPVTRFEPVNAQSHGCGCAGGGTMNVAQRIKALIDSGRFKDSDREWLEKVPEDRLSTLEVSAAAEPPAPPSTPPANPQPSTPPSTPSAPSTPSTPSSPTAMSANAQMTAEQYIAQAPPDLQDSLREGLRVQQEKRTSLITALKGTGRCPFSDEELAAMPTTQLERLMKLADAPAPISYGGRLSAARQTDAGVPPPPDLTAAIRSKRTH